MDDTLLIIAKVLGVYLIVSGLFLIFRGKTVPHMMKDLFDHPAVTYLAGAILIFLSVPLLLQYNIWDGTWRTVVTIFIWAIFLKGVAYILAPEMLQRMVTKKLMGALSLYGIAAVIGGAYLFLLG